VPHHAHTAGTSPWDALLVLALLAAAAGYALALWRNRHRSPWPVHRTVLWYAGLACAAAATSGPLAAAAATSFTAHMAGHVLLGMLAPLLLVLAAPVALVLRALPVAQARSFGRVLGGTPVRVLAHPVIALVLDAGGLWLLYGTDLFHLAHRSSAVGFAVHAHVLLAGCLLTAALVAPPPRHHLASLRVRVVVLGVFVAVHSALAKWLYAHPPTGVAPQDGRTGAQLMYYAGDVVDVALMVLLVAGWYSATRPRPVVPERSRVVPT